MQPPPGASPELPVAAGRRPSGAPRATYRVQMRGEFTFDDAATIAGYLAELGISHLYLSPILQAAPGSTHGYDVVDPTRVNRELGGADGHARLSEALGAAGLGQLLDVVPNHMAITGRDNAWWWDVLANGPASMYATYFDVDWDAPDRRLRNTVLLPILGEPYGYELEAGHLQVAREGGDFVVSYFDHTVPVDPSSVDTLLLRAAARLDTDVPEDVRVDLERIATSLERLPTSTLTDAAAVAERHSSARLLAARLAELCAGEAPVAHAVDAEVAALNGDIDALDALLDRQNYRLAWWRAAGESLDYRRFFDINDLAAIRVEEPHVFADSHRLILDWLSRGVIDGVRVDHVDGLLDPGRYLARIGAAAPSAWVLVEKITEGDETMPAAWPLDGTTGYDWLNLVGDLFVHPGGWERLVGGYREFTGVVDSFEEIAYRAKRAVLDGPMAADLNRLVALVGDVAFRHRRYRDYGRRDIHDALAEIASGFAVYRTYLVAGGDATVVAGAADVATVEQAVRTAGMRRPELDDKLLEFVRDLVLGRIPGPAETEIALRFQQLTGPVMAKAVEDTAFYRWLPLTARNEVGGDPGRLDGETGRFHAACAAAQRAYPTRMLTTSTHDTKRSEDVRARLSVVAELAEEWCATVERWWKGVHEMTTGAAPPDRNTAWLLLQTVVGAWPLTADRLCDYLEKATREAKEHTSWTDPDPIYDESIRAFATAVFDDPATVEVIGHLTGLVTRPGRVVALGLKLLTLTAPGVPDLYQGSELWDLSLVDPDNRRPVDYGLRRRLLDAAAERHPAEIWAGDDDDGLIKLLVVRAALGVRALHPAWWGPGPDGAYAGLDAGGPAAAHLVGFVRGPAARDPGAADDAAGAGAITLATRWPVLLGREGGWRDTTVTLPAGTWTDALGGGVWSGTVAVGDVLAGLPVALLVAEAETAGWVQ
jgi:(1->4)-alpha-D-glucan 1-alpha-D-glucosylmutase